jgi:hypothetical protein
MTAAVEVISSLRTTNAEIGSLVDRLGSSPTVEEYLEARASIGRLQAEFDEHNNTLSAALGLASAKARILRYLQAHVREVVTKEELAGVAGIFEFQRRIRELRSDEGWQISSMESHAHLRPGEYMLLSLEKDRSVTSDWDIARRIRSVSARPEEKLLQLMAAAHPRAVDIDVVRFALASDNVEGAVEAARGQGERLEVSTDPPTVRLIR